MGSVSKMKDVERKLVAARASFNKIIREARNLPCCDNNDAALRIEGMAVMAIEGLKAE